MTKGIFKFSVDQGIYDSLTISNLPTMRMVTIRQDNTTVMVRYDRLDELIDALKSAKKWST